MIENDFGNPDAFFNRFGTALKNPIVIQKTLQVLRDPDCSAMDLVQILEKEPAISSKVLKTANSAFYGTPKSITSLKAAIVRLGNHNISRIALSSALGASGSSAWGNFWKHSIGVAMLARQIARLSKSFTPQEAEELFSMGLLHDLGLLFEMSSGTFSEVEQALQGGDKTLAQAELEVYGFDHNMLGRLIAEKWNFPGDLVDAIAFHNQPDSSKDFYLKVAVIHVANLICHGFHFAPVPGEAPPPSQESYLQDLKLPVEQLVLFGDWLLTQKPEIEAFGDIMSS